jgi:hypothetical protein
LPLFRIARDPTTAAALADPYLGQSIGPVPGYGVSFFSCVMFIFEISIFIVFDTNLWYTVYHKFRVHRRASLNGENYMIK